MLRVLQGSYWQLSRGKKVGLLLLSRFRRVRLCAIP